MIASIRIEKGNLFTPDGMPFRGLKITIGGIQDPATIQRTYEDIEKVFKSNEVNFKTHEEHRPDGKFKTYTVET